MSYRLPRTVVPLVYEIYLNPSTEGFNGKVSISARVEKQVSQIVLNGTNIRLMKGNIQKNGRTYQVDVQYDPDLEFIYLIPETPLSPGDIKIQLEYFGRMTPDMKGLYRANYTNSEGRKHWVTATQFEATFARRVFPCFDEPEFKAEFTLTLEIDNRLEAFSNMPMVKREDNEYKSLISFETSPKMSTYTLAFVIGEYTTLKDHERQISILIPPGNHEEAKMGLYVAKSSIAFYERLLNMKYTLPKLDLIAIPESAAGAMENWGLVTFGFSAILTYPVSSAFDLYYVASTVSHELSHQFFGNLCTTKWWGTIWLNEGMATYFEYHGINASFPEWKIWDSFIYRVQQLAMDRDSFSTVHPLDNTLTSNPSISEMFDPITYDKGGSIMYMVEDIVGKDVLFRGLHKYLTECSFGSGTPEMLWKAVDSSTGQSPGRGPASGQPKAVDPSTGQSPVQLSEIMPSWTNQSGFPLITVLESPGGIRLRQERYLPYSESEELWWIVTTILCSDGRQIRVSFNTRESEFIPLTCDWYKVNHNQRLFARVLYPLDNWHHLVRASLNFTDRAGLLNDALTLAIDGKLSIETALEITYSILINEKHPSVWSSCFDLLYRFAALFMDHSCGIGFRDYMIEILGFIMSWVWESNDHQTAMLQAEILSAALFFDEPNVKEKCNQMYQEWLENPDSLSPDLQLPVFQNAIRTLGEPAYQRLLQSYLNENNPVQRKRYLDCITVVPDPRNLSDLLTMSSDPSLISPREQIDLVINIGFNPDGRALAWTFIKDNWHVFNTPGQLIQNIIKEVTWNFHTIEKYSDVKNFFANTPNAAPSSVANSLERIRYNMIWTDQNIDRACAWLEKFSENSPNRK